MSPLGSIMCIGSGMALLGVCGLLLFQTKRFELSRRAAWGMVAGVASGFCFIAPFGQDRADDPILAVILAGLAVAGMLWGRSAHAPRCVRQTTGWDEVTQIMPDRGWH